MPSSRLVRATRGLAEERDAEIRAQWKPVLLVRDRLPKTMRADRRGLAHERGTLIVWVENTGRGPALDVEAEIPGFGLPGPGYGAPEGEPPTPGAMSTRRSRAMAPGDLVEYR